jgi:ribonuclease Z
MRSRHTLLTHFSQRYPKNPLSTVAPLESWLSEEDKAFAKTQVVALASDFVSVAIGDLWKLPLYTDAIAALFEEQKDDDESDTESVSGKSVASGAGKGKPNKKAAKKAANAAAHPSTTASYTLHAAAEKLQPPQAKKAKSHDQSPREPSPRGIGAAGVSPPAKAAVDFGLRVDVESPPPAAAESAAAAGASKATPGDAAVDQGPL